MFKSIESVGIMMNKSPYGRSREIHSKMLLNEALTLSSAFFSLQRMFRIAADKNTCR